MTKVRHEQARTLSSRPQQRNGAKSCNIVWGIRTNRSSAVGDACLSAFDMLSDAIRIFCRLERVVRAGSRKGLRDTGRGGGSSKGDARVGEIARLRNGLFEDRLRVNPADL